MDMYKGMAGSPITYLAGDISAAQTTIAIADDSALPDAPNLCTIGYGENIETIRYGAKSNGVLQEVTRGIEGTPRAWQSGTEVARFFTAYDHNAIVETITSHLADYAALISGGDRVQLTTQNGWSGGAGLFVSKNNLRQLFLRGNLRAGTVSQGTTIAILPSGYRPHHAVAFSVYQSSNGLVANKMTITTDGAIVLRESVLTTDSYVHFNILFSIDE